MEIAWELILHHATVTLVTHSPSYSVSYSRLGPALHKPHSPLLLSTACLHYPSPSLFHPHVTLAESWPRRVTPVSFLPGDKRLPQNGFSANANKLQRILLEVLIQEESHIRLDYKISSHAFFPPQNLQLFALCSARLTGTQWHMPKYAVRLAPVLEEPCLII